MNETAFDNMPLAEKEAIRRVLLSRTLQNLIGAEEWDLTEEEENHLWSAIGRLEGLA